MVGGRRHALALIGVGAYGFLVLTGAVLAWLPPPPTEVLVAPNSWAVREGFVPTDRRPKASQARTALRSRELPFWHAHPLEGEGERRRLASEPFATPDVMLLPYMLQDLAQPVFPTVELRNRVRVELECMDSGERLRLARFPTNVRFAEMLVDVPTEFCPGLSRLIASTEFPYLLVIGTPHSTTRRAVLQESGFIHAFRHAVLLAVLGALGIAGALLARASGWRDADHSSFLIAIGTSGYAAFFVYWAGGASVGRAAFLLVLAAATWVALRARRDREDVRACVAELAPALAVWAIGSFFYVQLLHMVDTGAGAWHPSARFWPARWSTDNLLPQTVAEALVEGAPLGGLLGPHWQVSDRPPIQAGVGALLRPLASFVTVGGSEGPQIPWFHHTLGILVNALWLFAAMAMGRAIGFSRQSCYAALTVLALTPFAIFHTTYVWPKLFAAAYGLMTIRVLLRARIESPGESDAAYSRLSECACLAALSMLCHGGGVTFLLAAACWSLVRIGFPPLRRLLPALALAAILLAPWTAWQRLVDPPGNALIKSALTDGYGFAEKDVGVLETVERRFGQYTLEGWWGTKRWAFWQFVKGGPEPERAPWNWFEYRRQLDFFFVVPSLGILVLPILSVLLRPRPNRRSPAASYAASRNLIAIALLALFLSWILFLPRPWLHRQAYAGLLALLFAGIAASPGALGRFAFALWLASFVYGAATWIVQPALAGGRFDPIAALLCAGVLFAAFVRGARYALEESGVLPQQDA